MIVLVNPRDIPEIEGDKRFVLQPYNALSYSFFGYNMRNSLLAIKNVRKAFTYAVNRQEMLESFFNNRGTIISGPFAPGSWAYNLDVLPLLFDPEKAKTLLREAGFSAGADGFMQKDGKRLSFSLKVPIEKESEAVKRVVLAFKNYLKNIGVDINVEFKEWQAWKEDVFLEHDYDIVFASWVFDDSADISSLFHTGEIGAWKNNFIGYSNAEVDGLSTEQIDAGPREAADHQPEAPCAPGGGKPLYLPLDAHELRGVSQEAPARRDPSVQILLFRRRVVHRGERPEIMWSAECGMRSAE
jgi:peptide/nickel transport system substrate-binding protein